MKNFKVYTGKFNDIKFKTLFDKTKTGKLNAIGARFLFWSVCILRVGE